MLCSRFRHSSTIIKIIISIVLTLSAISLLSYFIQQQRLPILPLRKQNGPMDVRVFKENQTKRPVTSTISESESETYLTTCIDALLEQLHFRDFPSRYPSFRRLEIDSQLPIEDIVVAECQSFFQPPPEPSEDLFDAMSCYRKSVFNDAQLQIIRSSLDTIISLFQSQGVHILLDRGSLIGSWRHHGIIPYDDNIDLRIFKQDEIKVSAIFEGLKEHDHRNEFIKTESGWNLLLNCAVEDEDCFVMVNVHMMEIKGKMVVFDDDDDAKIEIPLSVIIPTKKRPFFGLLFDAPNDFEAYFKLMYGNDIEKCESFTQHGKNRKECELSKIDCELLRHYHPYVIRFRGNDNEDVEFLVQDKMISQVFAPTLLLL